MIKSTLLLLLCAFCLQLTYAQQISLHKLWERSENIHIPESVLYYASSDRLYVSLIGTGGEDNGEIAIMRPDGSMENPHWITGLNAPKGMAIHKGLLYIADVTKLLIVDIVTSNVIDEIEVDGATFLNDVAVDDTGVVFISDTRQHKIYQFRSGRISVFMSDVKNVNGLKIHNGILLACAGKELWQIDRNKKVTVLASGFQQGGDGIEPINNGGYIVTCWAGLIYYVSATGEIEKIQDVQGKMNTADLGYNAKENVIYIPTFNNNSVIAYKLQ